MKKFITASACILFFLCGYSDDSKQRYLPDTVALCGGEQAGCHIGVPGFCSKGKPIKNIVITDWKDNEWSFERHPNVIIKSYYGGEGESWRTLTYRYFELDPFNIEYIDYTYRGRHHHLTHDQIMKEIHGK